MRYSLVWPTGGDSLLRLLRLSIKAFATTILKFSNVITMFCVNNMAVYNCNIYEIKKHFQVKAIIAFTIESVSSCFLIHYIYTIHAIVVKLDDVRTRSRCFG